MLDNRLFKYEKVKGKDKFIIAVERATKHFPAHELTRFVEIGGSFRVKQYFTLLGFHNLEAVRKSFTDGSRATLNH